MLSHPDTSDQQDAKWQQYVNEIVEGKHPSFEDHWAFYQQNFKARQESDGPPIVWQPKAVPNLPTNITQFIQGLGLKDYESFYEWSIREKAQFWEKAITAIGIQFSQTYEQIMGAAQNALHPAWLKGANMNIVDSCFTSDLDKLAIISAKEGEEKIQKTTYAELLQLVERVAGGLQHHFPKGARIALYMPMNLACVAAYLGIIKAGGIVISIADSFPAAEVKKRLGIADAVGIITVDSYQRAGKEIHLYEKVKEAEATRAIVIGTASVPIPELRQGDIHWVDFISHHSHFSSSQQNPNETTNILFSSGTTGVPKAIPWTHTTPIKCAMDGYFHQDIHPEDVVAWPTNIGWMMGPWLIFASLINGATMALYEGAPTGSSFIRFVEESGISILGTIPSLVRAWRASGDLDTGRWKNIRLYSSTGEASGEEDYLWLMSLSNYQAPIIEYCGGTELGGGYMTGTIVQAAALATFSTAALGMELVMIKEEGEFAQENEMGELFLVPPSIGLSESLLNKHHQEVYYRNCPTGPNGELLRRHGDQVKRLSKGFYKAQGRVDDSMNLGGIKISSLELEQVLDADEHVYESAAISIQPAGSGPFKLVVYIVLENEVNQAELKKVLNAALAKKMNPLFRIFDLVVVEKLPRTASNKIMRRTLRAMYMEGYKRSH